MNRQTDREKQLQKRFAELQAEFEDLQKGRHSKDIESRSVAAEE